MNSVIVNELIDKVKTYQKKQDIEKIIKAFDFCKNAHSKQYRMSGEPFYHHPLEVAKLLTEIKLDSSVDDLPEWDSFGHFEIIMAIEKEFNIKLEVSDFPNMTSIPKIKNKILEYLDEQ